MLLSVWRKQGLIRYDNIMYGKVWHERCSVFCCCHVVKNPVVRGSDVAKCCSLTWRGSARHKCWWKRRDEARRGEAGRGEERQGKAMRCDARRGDIKRDEARRYKPRRGEAKRSEARRIYAKS